MDFIDLGRQYDAIAERLSIRVGNVMREGQYILGPEVAELEQRLVDYSGAKYCVGVANGTDALHLALRAADIGPGDAVFVPSFTFVACAEVIPLVGADTVFVDVDEHTFNMDPEDFARKLDAVQSLGNHRPAAVIPVDLFGLPADYQKINEIADAANILVIEDAAQSFGGSNHGSRAGSLAPVATTSFFPAKPLGCYGDGGAVFTDNEHTLEVLRSLRVHGKGAHKYDNVRIGLNSRLDTLQAAILLEKLLIFDDELAARERLAARYDERLKDRFRIPTVPEGMRSSWAQYTLRAEPSERDDLRTWAAKVGIPTGIYYPKPLHQQTAYRDQALIATNCPVSERLSAEVFSLPMHPYLRDDEIDHVCDRLLAWNP
jgi:dTDP-4-amino-4,6-dideoxygalactose transaminase